MKVQKGSTLIVVLILLLVITVIGTLAVRQSLTSLYIATNSQAQQLL
ncbi:MAG: PilX N-terminal domain-containing pilus assembly protein, partial [Acinetobacter calcoaceticus]